MISTPGASGRKGLKGVPASGAAAEIAIRRRLKKDSGMAKILSMQKMRQTIQKRRDAEEQLRSTEDDITAILNDHSLTPAHRRWKLENMLMNIDEQLEEFKKELEEAEGKLNELVVSAEADITEAYAQFEAKVRGMTRAVRKLTGTPAEHGSP